MRDIRGIDGKGYGDGYRQIYEKYYVNDSNSKNDTHNVYEMAPQFEEIIHQIEVEFEDGYVQQNKMEEDVLT